MLPEFLDKLVFGFAIFLVFVGIAIKMFRPAAEIDNPEKEIVMQQHERMKEAAKGTIGRILHHIFGRT